MVISRRPPRVPRLFNAVTRRFSLPVSFGPRRPYRQIPASTWRRRSRYAGSPQPVLPAASSSRGHPDLTDPAGVPVVVDSLAVDVLSDNVSDTYVTKTTFAVSEFANVVLAGATEI